MVDPRHRHRRDCLDVAARYSSALPFRAAMVVGVFTGGKKNHSGGGCAGWVKTSMADNARSGPKA
jgi:hypothetical protein